MSILLVAVLILVYTAHSLFASLFSVPLTESLLHLFPKSPG